MQRRFPERTHTTGIIPQSLLPVVVLMSAFRQAPLNVQNHLFLSRWANCTGARLAASLQLKLEDGPHCQQVS